MKPTRILLVGILGLFFSTNNILAQKTMPTTNVGGKTFYKYTLAQGESLKAVAAKYKLSLADIYRDNPKARNGVKAGTVLFIPKNNKQVASLTKKTTQKKGTTKKQTGKKTTPQTNTKRVYTSSQFTYTRHKVTKGENLFRISQKYKVSLKTIQKWNKLSGNRIVPGQELIVGVGKRRASKRNTMRKRMAMRKNTKNKNRRYRSQAPDKGKIGHEVKKGEWLGTIAKKYKVSVNDLKKWNDLKSDKIKAGDMIWVYVNDVTKYENPGGLTPPKNNPDVIGNKKNPNDNPMDIKPKGDEKGKITHIVQKSETLYKISRKYKVTVREIKQWNKLSSSNYIKAGTSLVIYPKGYKVKDNNGNQNGTGNKDNGNTHIYQKPNPDKKRVGGDNPMDIVGSKDKYVVDGKKKVKYKVQSGDNLWKISQMYKVKSEDIQTWNNLRNADDLVVGQTLNIYTKHVPKTTNSGGIPKPNVNTGNPVKQSNDVFDLIRPGGSLYGNKPKTQTPPPAKMKKQPVKQPAKKVYKQAQPKTNASSVGRKPVKNTYVPPTRKIYKQPAKKVVKKKTFQNPPVNKNPVTSPIRNNNKPAAATTRPSRVIKNPTRTTKTDVNNVVVFEKGMAGMLEVGQDSQKYQAFHRTAPVGSFVSVTNLNNGKLVIVSVIGKLSDDTPKNVIIKLTKRAYDQMEANGQVPVELSYEFEKN